jgi:hypothetical protein
MPFRRFIIRATILAALALCALAARAQQPLTVTMQLFGTPSPALSDWPTHPEIASMQVTNRGTQRVQFRVHCEIRSGDRIDARTDDTRSGIYSIDPGPFPQAFDGTSIFGPVIASSDRVMKTGMLPDGEHSIRVTLVDAFSRQTNSNEVERSFATSAISPPALIVPANRSVVANSNPVFQWAPAAATGGVLYSIRIAEVLRGQAPPAALEGNTPQLEIDLPSTSLTYPQDAQALVGGRTYVWQVSARPAASMTSANRAKGEIWTFTYQAAVQSLGVASPMDRIECRLDSIRFTPGSAASGAVRIPGLGWLVRRARDAMLLPSLYAPARKEPPTPPPAARTVAEALSGDAARRVHTVYVVDGVPDGVLIAYDNGSPDQALADGGTSGFGRQPMFEFVRARADSFSSNSSLARPLFVARKMTITIDRPLATAGSAVDDNPDARAILPDPGASARMTFELVGAREAIVHGTLSDAPLDAATASATTGARNVARASGVFNRRTGVVTLGLSFQIDADIPLATLTAHCAQTAIARIAALETSSAPPPITLVINGSLAGAPGGLAPSERGNAAIAAALWDLLAARR